MSKRNVMYIKPDEPTFLKKLKSDAGYKEDTTVESKFETLPTGPDNLSSDDSEEPQLVILEPGDLTKEEVEVEKKIISEEKESKPADLNEPVVFKPRPKTMSEMSNSDKRKSKKPMKVNKITLSFDDNEDES
ncbi:uncharacterized protein KIAA1143 homolog isoform X2 [Arctopsyche grandis]